MDNFLQKYSTPLIKGGIITLIMALMLTRVGLIIVSPIYVSSPIYIFIHILSFVFCWLLISFLINKFSLYKVMGVLGLLVTAILAEHYLDILNNPFTIPLLILFWLGVAYLVLPEFFKKYRIAILAVYAIVIFSYYFFFFKTSPDYAENHRLNFVNFMLIPIPVFVAFWVYEQWRWLKTLQADKAKAELALLKSQINPHFFFNTLNNLYGLVVEKSEEAPEVVLKLSDMMRYTIYEGKEDYVSLKDEVEYLENYIELHKIRYQKKVDISFSHSLEKDHRIAPLLFIILLENAFKHGVAHLTQDAYVHINLSCKKNDIYFQIENNYDEQESIGTNGIGLDNLKQRLKLIYPNKHQLTIEKENRVYKAILEIDTQ